MNSATAITGTTSTLASSANEKRTRLGAPVVLLSSLMLLAFVLRVWGIGTTNLWLDEANSWHVATLSWTGMLDNLRASPLGPLYFAALKLWIALAGDGEGALRAPSLIAGVLLVPVTWAIGARALSRRAAAVGAFLVALSPLHLYFSREARMYMPLALLGAGCTLGYLRWRMATFTPGAAARQGVGYARRGLAWSAALGAAALLTNPVIAPLLAALGLDALLALLSRGAAPVRRRALAEWVVAQVAMALPFLVLLALVHAGAADASQSWRGALGVEGALRGLFELPLTAVHGIYYYAHDFVPAAQDAWRYGGLRPVLRFLELLVVGPLTLLVLVAAIAAAARGGWRGARRTLWLALLVPTLAGTVISVRAQLDLGRYMLYATPFLLLLVADGVERMRRPAAALSLATLVAAMVLGTVHTDQVPSRDSDYRPVARVIGGDGATRVVVVQPPEMREPLSYYLRDAGGRRIVPVPKARPIAPVLAALAVPRAWVVLDYRSPVHDASPRELAAALGAPVLRDVDTGGGVRMLLVGGARSAQFP